MIEAVIWDFGGVLTSSPFEAFARYERERGLPADIIRRTNAANHHENAWAKFERAEIGLDEFDALFAAESRALGAEVRGRDVLPLLSGDLRPAMVEALARVKAAFKTGCITNNLPANQIGSRTGRSLYVAEVMALFDHVIMKLDDPATVEADQVVVVILMSQLEHGFSPFDRANRLQ